MKQISWVVMAACFTLSACGGDNASSPSGSASSARTTQGASSNPVSPGSQGSLAGGASQLQAGWSQPAAMDGKFPETKPSVTIDKSGNVLATWMTNGASGSYGNEMWGARYVPGSGWGVATRLDSSDGTHTMNSTGMPQPQLVGNANGQAVAFWTEWMPGPNKYALWARPYSPALGWRAAIEVAPDVGDVSYTAGIDNQGNAIVAWQKKLIDAVNSRIAWTRYAANGLWSPTTLIQMPALTGPGTLQGDTYNIRPMISVTPSGRAVLAWTQTNGVRSAIWTATYVPDNGWINVNQAVSESSLFNTISVPVAGMDDKGNITLVWGQTDVANSKIYISTMSQRYVPLVGWQMAQAVAAPIVDPVAFVATPMLTVNGSGIAAVMWAKSGSALQVSVSDASGKWGPLYQLTGQLNGKAPQLPVLVVDAAGNATAAWNDVDASGTWNVVASSYRGAWSTPTMFAPHAMWPALAVNAAGAMAFVWQLNAGSNGLPGPDLQESFYTPGS